MHLSDGTKLPSDGLVVSTSWLHGPGIQFRPAEMHSELGIPSAHYSAEQREFWRRLDAKADEEVFARLPILKGAPQPTAARNGDEFDALRLYRGLAPPGLTSKGDRSVIFQGLQACQ